MIERNILAALASELAESRDELTPHFDVLSQPAGDPSDVAQAADQLRAFLTRLAEGADIVEFEQLGDLCRFVIANVEAAEQSESDAAPWQGLAVLIRDWLQTLQACLDDPENIEQLGALLLQSQDAGWPVPMAEERAEELAESLSLTFAQALSETDGADAAAVDAASLSLTFAEDVDPRLIDVFHIEVPDQVRELSALVADLAAGRGELEDLRKAQRTAHTVKGTANIVGLSSIATLTHRLEDVFDELVAHRRGVSPGLADVLIDATDCLQEITESIIENTEPPGNFQAVLDALGQWESLMDADAEAPEETAEEDATSPAETHTPVKQAPAQPRAAAAHDAAAAEGVTRVSGRSIRVLSSLAGEMATSLVQVEGELSQTGAKAKMLHEHNAVVHSRMNDLQDLLELRSIPVQRMLAGSRVGQTGFDPLEMDEYNELHSAANALAESLRDTEEFTDLIRASLGRIQEMRHQLDGLSNELNDTLTSTRLSPLETVVARLQRGVRQAAKTVDKQVDLEITGAELQIDNQIIDRMVAPILHVLRNAVDHGIEEAPLRLERGKPERGKIEVKFSRRGESLLIEVVDDGGGFDVELIRGMALSSGLVKSDQGLDEQDWLNLTTMAGFTTRDEASQVSGRGIGMDVVSRAIEELRGTLEIYSEAGRGSRIVLRVPLTLISMHLLLFKVGHSHFATPSSGLEQVLYSDAGEIVQGENGPEFVFAEEHHPLLSLKSLLGYPEETTPSADDPVRPLLLVSLEDQTYALSIDQALNGRSLVVNRFSDFVPRINGVMGASIQANGGIAPVLDLVELLKRPMSRNDTVDRMHIEMDKVKAHTVLVVDDSISARGSMIETLKNAGYKTLSAVDGLEAVSLLEKNRPDALVIDLEMPRMNGLELAAHVRSRAALKHLPLLMVTSRSTAKHRDMALKAGVDEFYNKPYQELEFLTSLHELIRKN